MDSKRTSLVTAVIASMSLTLTGCVNHFVEPQPQKPQQQTDHYFPQTVDKKIDILFVVDNSSSMGDEQANLSTNFPRLIEALRNYKLGPDGSGKPCSASDQSGCKIPDVQIGVVSTDLGIGSSYDTAQVCSYSGDAGRLKIDRKACTSGPVDDYISYSNGVTNINAPAIKDPIEKVKSSFSCMAKLGTSGCGYEHPMEAARKALDPKKNPGFLRPDALLAVVFITDEDDCSASNQNLFKDLASDPLGFRCFERAVRCDDGDPQLAGLRQGCKPLDASDGNQMLWPVSSYVSHFKGLKPAGRVIVSAIAGPTDKVEVLTGKDHAGQEIRYLSPSCTTNVGGDGNDNGKGNGAYPAIRIKAMADAFGPRGQFSTICTDNFGPALARLGDLIVASLNGHCIAAPPVNFFGNPVCSAGDKLGTDSAGNAVECESSCLSQADCVVEELLPGGARESVPRCDASKFADPANSDSGDSGDSGPCWRLVHKPGECDPQNSGSPYKLEVLRKGKPAQGAAILAKCGTALAPWGSAALADQPQCN